MPSYDMILRNGTVWTVGGPVQTSVAVRDGKIAAIHTGLVSKATYQKQLESLLTEGAHARSGADTREYAFFRARY